MKPQLKFLFALLGFSCLLAWAATAQSTNGLTMLQIPLLDMTGSTTARTITLTPLDPQPVSWNGNLYTATPINLTPVPGGATNLYGLVVNGAATNMVGGNWKLSFQGIPRAATIYIPFGWSNVVASDPQWLRNGISQVFTYTNPLYAGQNISIAPTNGGLRIDVPMQLTVGHSVNLAMMGNVNLLLQGGRNTEVQPVTIMSFGDSTAEYFRSAPRVLIDTLGSVYGIQECDAEDDADQIWWTGTFSGGPTGVQNADTNYSLAAYILLTNGCTVTYTNAFRIDGNARIQAIRVNYVMQPLGGLVNLLVNTGSGFSPAAQINTYGTDYSVHSTNVSVDTFVKLAQFKFTTTGNGTNILPGFSTTRSFRPLYDKIKSLYWGQGGMNLDQLLASPSNTIYTAFVNANPDLFIFKMLHEDSWDGVNGGGYIGGQTNFYKLLNFLTNACPNVQILLMAAPTNAPSDQWDFPQQANTFLRTFALTNPFPVMYADLGDGLAITPSMTNSWFVSGDGTHFTIQAYSTMLQPFLKYWGWPLSQPASAATPVHRLNIGGSLYQPGYTGNPPDPLIGIWATSGQGGVFQMQFNDLYSGVGLGGGWSLWSGANQVFTTDGYSDFLEANSGGQIIFQNAGNIVAKFDSLGNFTVVTNTSILGLSIENEIGWPSGSTWIDVPTTGISGIGTGGVGSNPWWAYVPSSGIFFSDAQAGDVVSRNTSGAIRFGNSNGHS
ncbi:MAG: hypothetical protein KGL39_17800, partial [Patescibacteria group bacterium]|nr:hypothetical protein [Patescibacteria group bacterium]